MSRDITTSISPAAQAKNAQTVDNRHRMGHRVSTTIITPDREKRMGIQQSERLHRLNPDLQKKIADRTRRERIQELERRKLENELRNEKDPNKLAERLTKAKNVGVDTQKDENRHKKMTRAQERIKNAVKRLTNVGASDSVRRGISEIQSGRLSGGLHEFRDTGREGAVGNEVSSASAEMAKGGQTLTQETGKHAESLMHKILKKHSAVLVDKMYDTVSQDKSDANREGRQTQDSTMKQMQLRMRNSDRS